MFYSWSGLALSIHFIPRAGYSLSCAILAGTRMSTIARSSYTTTTRRQRGYAQRGRKAPTITMPGAAAPHHGTENHVCHNRRSVSLFISISRYHPRLPSLPIACTYRNRPPFSVRHAQVRVWRKTHSIQRVPRRSGAENHAA